MSGPAPPRELVMPPGLQHGLVAVLAVAAVLALVALVRTAVRDRSTVPMLVLLGALLCVVYEPIGDRMVLAYYPEKGQLTWVTLFGRGIPVFIGLMYVAYIGPFLLLFEHLRRRGFTLRAWWALWAGSIATIVVVELAVLRIGAAWVYYGPQRTVLSGLPVWTPFTYVAFLFAIATGVHALASHLPARRQWLIVPAVPALLAAAHVTTSLPAAIALSRSTDPAVILAGALASMALSALGAHTLGRVFVAARRGGSTPNAKTAGGARIGAPPAGAVRAE